MNQFKTGAILTFVIALFFITCGKEDAETTVNTSDFSVTIDENPAVGQNLGTASATTNQGDLTYTLSSSSPTGAFTVDASSGAISVADKTLFDYEERESLAGVVTVSNDGISKNINVLVLLNDVKASAADLNTLQRTWEMVNFSYAGVMATLMNHSCRLDDAMEFKADGTYLYDGGTELCGGEDSQQQKAGTWDLDENLNFVLFDKGTNKELEANIDLFTPTNLNMSGTYVFTSFSGETVPQ